MDRSLSRIGFSLLLLCACGRETSAPASQPAAPHAPPAAPAHPTPAPEPAPSEASPCRMPTALTLELESGVVQKTPWGLELTFAVDEDAKRGPGYMFLLHDGTHRWQTRRDDDNWARQLTWRGFCWRIADRPERRAKRVRIQIAPVCKDGRLQELGGCGDALRAR